MAIAGMVLGIVAIIFAFVPVVGAFISFPCIGVGLPLAIVGFLRNRKAGLGTGMAIAGIATNAVALLIVIIWLAAVGAALSEFSDEIDTGNGGNFGTGGIAVPAFGGIDRSVKDNVGMMGPRPTDGEIQRACQALRRAEWDFMSLGMSTDARSLMIAASITHLHPETGLWTIAIVNNDTVCKCSGLRSHSVPLPSFPRKRESRNGEDKQPCLLQRGSGFRLKAFPVPDTGAGMTVRPRERLIKSELLPRSDDN